MNWVYSFSENLIRNRLQVEYGRGETEWQKKKKSLVAKDAANSLTIADVFALTATKLRIAIAALATAEQQAADKNLILRPNYSVVKKW